MRGVQMKNTIYKITAMKFEDPKDGEAAITAKYTALFGLRPALSLLAFFFCLFFFISLLLFFLCCPRSTCLPFLTIVR